MPTRVVSTSGVHSPGGLRSWNELLDGLEPPGVTLHSSLRGAAWKVVEHEGASRLHEGHDACVCDVDMGAR